MAVHAWGKSRVVHLGLSVCGQQVVEVVQEAVGPCPAVSSYVAFAIIFVKKDTRSPEKNRERASTSYEAKILQFINRIQLNLFAQRNCHRALLFCEILYPVLCFMIVL